MATLASTIGRMRRRPRAWADDGIAMVEFALLLPFFIVLLFGIIEFAQAVFFQAALQHAVTAAARCYSLFQATNALGSGNSPPDCSSTGNVQTVATQQAYGLKIATSVFTHLYPAEILNYIRESHRVLVPGGRLYSTWFLIREDETDPKPDREFVRRDGYWTARPGDDRQAIGISLSTASRMLADARMEVTAVHDGRWSGRVGTMGARQDIIVARAG